MMHAIIPSVVMSTKNTWQKQSELAFGDRTLWNLFKVNAMFAVKNRTRRSAAARLWVLLRYAIAKIAMKKG